MLSTSLSLWPKASVRVVLVAQRREYDVEHCGTYDLGILLKGWLWSTSLRGLLPSPKEIIEEGAYSDVFCSPALSNVYSFAVLPPKAHHSQWCPAKRKTKSTAWNSWNSVCGWVRSTWSKTKVRSELETQKNPSSERMSTEAHNLFTVNFESLDLWKMSCGSSCGSVWFLFALSTNIQQDSMHSRRASGSCYALPKALAIEGSRWHWSLSNIGLTPQSKCPPAELQHQGNELLQVRKPRKEKLHSLTLRQPQQLGSKWEERNKERLWNFECLSAPLAQRRKLRPPCTQLQLPKNLQSWPHRKAKLGFWMPWCRGVSAAWVLHSFTIFSTPSIGATESRFPHFSWERAQLSKKYEPKK